MTLKQLLMQIANKILFVVLLFSNNSYAFDNSKQPITIQAENVELKNKQGLVIYTNKVYAKQNNQELFADKLILTRDETGKLKKIKAFGKPAKLIKDKDIITGDTLTYDFSTEILTAQSNNTSKNQATVILKGKK